MLRGFFPPANMPVALSEMLSGAFGLMPKPPATPSGPSAGKSIFDLRAYLDEKRVRIHRALDQYLPDEPRATRLKRAMRHSLMAGGKRLRPILCLAAAEAVGGKDADVMPAACALEMIHTYSLIHDDLPAMDDDALRRGRPTCHIQFDEATAILAGDALLTLAFQVLADAASGNDWKNRALMLVLQEIGRAAGCEGMIEGQMRDMAAENTHLTLAALEAMHALKTGALIRASVRSGAILGRGTTAQVRQLDLYAERIGLAFQVTDDILNVEGDPERMGKAAGTDAERHKCTYPALLGLAASKELARTLTEEAIGALSDFDEGAAPLRAIAAYILERRR